jgi:hypothetical protein
MRKKSSRERLLDSLNSIVKKERVHCEKKEKFRVEGFVIARILSWKEEEFVKRLRDSQNPIVKKRKSSCERLPDSQNSIVKKERVRCEKRKIL